MSALKFEIVPAVIKDYQSVRVLQGQVHVGPEPQQTYLRSCVCVGFYHPTRRLGALSHITGFSEAGGHSAPAALRELESRLTQHGLRLADCECFVIGGAELARHVFDSAIRELRDRRLQYRELDVLGTFHRKLLLNPQDGTLALFKSQPTSPTKDHDATFSADPALNCFQDRRRRLFTGASLFFRNPELLQCLREAVIPAVLRSFKRCHIWCAGCSTGMEVYSLGMVALDTLARSKQPQFELRLLGTDVSEEALAQGRLGDYALSARMEDSHADLFRQYCERVDPHTVRIGQELRARSSFAQRDIREGSRRHRFELVVCDHVLQYFTPEIQLEFLQGLTTGVRPGGFIYVSSPSALIRDTLLASGEYEMLSRSFYSRRQP